MKTWNEQAAALSAHPWFYYLAILIPLGFSALLAALFAHPLFNNLPLHAAVEAMGGITGLHLFTLLFLKSERSYRSYFPLAQCGLLAMGILDLFHSFATPGASFIWLHGIGTLAGGFFFALVWAPAKIIRIKKGAPLPIIVLGGAIGIGLWALFFPEALPPLLVQGHFTLTAKGINLLGGCLFLAAAGYFFRMYRQRQRRFDEILFANFCLLFGFAGIIFVFSRMWNAAWWTWHFVRLFSYGLALFYMLDGFRRAEKAICESEERFRGLVESCPDIMYVFSNKQGGLYYSHRVGEALGYSPGELLGNSFIWLDLIHPDDRANVDYAIKSFHQGSSSEIEYRIRDRLGNWHWFFDRFIREINSGDEIIIEGLATDITRRKQAAEELQKSEEKYRNLVDNAPVGVFTSTVAGNLIFVNDAMVRLLGFAGSAEIRKRGAFSLYANPADRKTLMEKLKKNGKVTNFESSFRTKQGSVKDVLLSVVLSGDRLSGTIMDITERKGLVQALRQSELFLNEVGWLGKIGGWEMDLGNRQAKWTKATYDIVEIDAEQPVPGLDEHLAFYLPEYRPMIRKAFRALIEEDKPLDFEAQLRTARGNVKWCRTLGRAHHRNGKCVRLSGIFQDISASKLLEISIRESEKRFRAMVENIPGFVYRGSLKVPWRLEYVSEAAFELTGYSAQQFVETHERNFGDLILAEDLPKVKRVVEEAVTNRSRFEIEYRIRHASGDICWVYEKGRASYDEDGKPLWLEGVIVDITARKRAEMQLQEYADTQTVLLREVNHRVKNNLAVIVGMLHKEEDLAESKGQTSFLPLLHDLEGRIMGLLAVHRMFSASNWQPLLLSQLCEQIISGVLKPYAHDIKLNISAVEVLVDSNQAHHLSMVINELATNSLKYAIGASTQTIIAVDIGEEDGQVLLTFRDNGPGYSENVLRGEYARTSIGFNLVNGIVKKSLRGTIALRNDNGAVAEIRFDRTEQPWRNGP
jgi:PAS domain S-box-containing protein